jgi:hypothetical protein
VDHASANITRLVNGTEGKIGAYSGREAWQSSVPGIRANLSGRLSVAKVGRANNEAGDLLFDGRAFLV